MSECSIDGKKLTIDDMAKRPDIAQVVKEQCSALAMAGVTHITIGAPDIYQRKDNGVAIIAQGGDKKGIAAMFKLEAALGRAGIPAAAEAYAPPGELITKDKDGPIQIYVKPTAKGQNR